MKSNNFKVVFANWLKSNLNRSTGTQSSYIRAIEVLSEILKKELFAISDVSELSELYNDLLIHQKDEKGKYFYSKASAYGYKGFYSAAIKKYIQFHQESPHIKSPEIRTNNTNPVFMYKNFIINCRKTNLLFQDSLISRYTASLLTKPFVILTGLSGSGKTKLAQAFAMWICQNKEQYKIVPVGADWTNREPLLGFPDALKPASYVEPDSGVLKLIIRASQDEKRPYFLILDEMNLSHVERYFADFLSAMESNEKILLHSGTEDWDGIPPAIRLPENLFIVGTVNIDETTYMFSPKVLDRASVIEFRVTEAEMSSYLSQAGQLDMKALEGKGAGMAESFVQLSKTKDKSYTDADQLNVMLVSFFAKLKVAGAEFGYRTASEIRRFAAVTELLETGWTSQQVLDAAIMQKLLPKLHGSRRKLEPVLKTLIGLCLVDGEKPEDYLFASNETSNDKILYPVSLEKLQRMYRGLVDNGFTSYAEA